MVTVVPPAAGPEMGERLLTVRDVVPKLNAPGRDALVPSGLVTAMLTDPAACGGVVAVSWVAFTKETLAAGLPPKETFAPLTKLVPPIVTTVPPAVPPEFGETLLTVRDDVPNVNAPGSIALVPSGSVTATLTDPAACAGVMALSWVELTNETLDAELPPKETVAPLTKLDPIIVTTVPPAVSPEFGETPLTVGEDAV